MLKKQIAFFTLFLFFLSQFGKVINFSFCKAVAYQQTNTFVCDCEKLLYTVVKTDNTSKEQPPQQLSAHQTTEELFHFKDHLCLTGTYAAVRAEWPLFRNSKHLSLFANAIFHPPAVLA